VYFLLNTCTARNTFKVEFVGDATETLTNYVIERREAAQSAWNVLRWGNDFDRALKRFVTVSSQFRALVGPYREERVAEIIKGISRDTVALIYGGGHDFRISFEQEQLQRRFRLVRHSWFQQPWFQSLLGDRNGYPDVGLPKEKEMRIAQSIKSVRLDELQYFADENALTIALRKLRPDSKFTAAQYRAVIESSVSSRWETSSKVSPKVSAILGWLMANHQGPFSTSSGSVLQDFPW
jgi:hypothetical protein